ncbi:MAG: hypothetical protein QM811_17760 [Pirellulales bacterium]
MLRKVVEQNQGTLAPPHSHNPDSDLGNPTEFLIVASALRNEQEAVGVVEIFHRTGNMPNVERGYLRFLLQMCDVANDYLKTHRLRQFTSRQAMWSQLAQFTRLVHRELDPNETAYTIANEGRRLIECDRVSVAVAAGSRFRLRDQWARRLRQTLELGRQARAPSHGRVPWRRAVVVLGRNVRLAAADRRGGRSVRRRVARQILGRSAVDPRCRRRDGRTRRAIERKTNR